MAEMISLEEARSLVLSAVFPLGEEVVPLLESCGRVACAPLSSDIDISPFAHSAMDGFALRASQIASATEAAPVPLKVIAEEAAGEVFEGPIGEGECVRIMTGAPLPADADSVVKYEIVEVLEGDGKPGSTVAFAAPTERGSNVRQAGEEARAGDVVIQPGDVIGTAGVGFLASCGILDVPVHRRPVVGILAIGSELVQPPAVPTPGKIRNSNSYAMAACAQAAGAVPRVYPIVEDTFEALCAAITAATAECDFVLTTGGASNGDFDFIKPVVESLGTLLMTTVNIRPGKAQTFGVVNDTPVFGLPGNPAAAYVGFELLVRPALRRMQGFAHVQHMSVQARLAKDVRKRDPRRIFLRSTISRCPDGGFEVMPDKNQSSGLFGPIQRSNCLAVMPEGLESKQTGDLIECLLLGVPEDLGL